MLVKMFFFLIDGWLDGSFHIFGWKTAMTCETLCLRIGLGQYRVHSVENTLIRYHIQHDLLVELLCCGFYSDMVYFHFLTTESL